MAETFSILPLAALSTLFLTSIFFFFFIIFYLFATKCFHNIRHHHLLRRLTLLRQPPPSETNTNDEDPFIAFTPSPWRSITNDHRRLHNVDIQHIPTLQFKQKPTVPANDVPYDGCVVCLNKFEEQDVLRVLPACGHGFHLDCIDIWLQSNANCPLCRINISGKSLCQNPTPVVAPSSSPQSSCRFSQMGDEDFVVIELGGNSLEEERVGERPRGQEISIMNRDMLQSNAELDFQISDSNARKEQSSLGMTGDEYINIREKNRDDFFFPDQPIRRSFSLDSAVNKQQIYSTVQAIIQQNRADKQIRLFSFRNP